MAGIVKTLQFAEGTIVDAPTISGSGAGEKNYITAGSNSSGWGQVGDLDVATTTTAADLPREYTTGSGIKITADANTQSIADYVYYDFTLDDVDLNKKLKIQWSQKTTGTYAAGDLAVVITTQADRTTAVATPITTAIPAADGVFTTSFDTGSTATLSLVIRATTDMATNGGLVISDVVVGPGTQPQGAVVGPVLSCTPTLTVVTTGNGTLTGEYYEDGEYIEYYYTLTFGSTTSVGGTIRPAFPTGIGRTPVLPSNRVYVGEAKALDSGTAWFTGAIFMDSSGNFQIDSNNAAAAWGTTVPFTWTTNDQLLVRIRCRANELVGRGTVNVAQNDVIYLSNSSTTNADDSLSFAYGPAGSTVPVTLTTAHTKRVRSPVSLTGADIVLKFQDQSGNWLPVGQIGEMGTAGYPIQSFNYITTGAGASSFGAGFRRVSGSTTDIDVYFGRYHHASYDGGTTQEWGALNTDGIKWRVEVRYPGQAVGFGHVAQNSSGLVKSAGQLLGTNTNDSAATGYVGEYVSANPGAGVTPGSSGAFKTLTSISLTAGDWDVEGMALLDPGTGTGFTRAIVGISKTTNTMDLQTEGGIQTNHGTLSSNTYTGTGNRRITVANGATQTVYLVGYADYSAAGTSTWTTNSIIRARRVR